MEYTKTWNLQNILNKSQNIRNILKPRIREKSFKKDIHVYSPLPKLQPSLLTQTSCLLKVILIFVSLQIISFLYNFTLDKLNHVLRA